MKLSTIVLSVLALCVGPTQAQDSFPTKPIRLVVPQSPGSGGDMVGRMLGEFLSNDLGQPVVIDNKAGANGIPAAAALSKERPDGYTLMLGLVSQLAINKHLYKNVPYDGLSDFTYVSPVVETPYVLVASNASGFKSVADIVAAAKLEPGKLNYSSAGTGNMTHLSTALLASTLGINLTHVPYKGSAPALASVTTGETQLMTSVVGSALAQIQAGMVKPIAIIGNSRVSVLADVPTIAELGIKMPPVPGWYALVAPPSLDAQAQQRIAASVQRFLTNEDVKARLATLYLVPTPGTGAQLLARARQESDLWGQFIRDNNILPD